MSPPQKPLSLRGLVAATFTPLNYNGSLNLAAIRPIVEHLIQNGISGLYILGSTGEGPSLTYDERCSVAEEFVYVANGRLPVIVQCGCDSLSQASQLAAHAQKVGADAVSAVSPVYFRPDSVESLVKCMAEIAASAPDLPFYYYHIPSVTGDSFNMNQFLSLGGDRIPTLRGIKFTSPQVNEFQSCVELAGDRFEILWGMDEMLLSGLAAGAHAAVGSTYNFAAPLYHRIIKAMADGDLQEARYYQSCSQAIIRSFLPYGLRAAQKPIMSMIGLDCGPTRLPIAPLKQDELNNLYEDLKTVGFFDWINHHSEFICSIKD